MGIHAASCTSQASMTQAERSAVAEASLRLLTAVGQQDTGSLKAALLPTEGGEWPAIHTAADQAVPLVDGGQMRLRNLYMIDASSATSTADTQVFCSNAAGSLTVIITLAALPPGKYAVVLADATGAKLAGQIGLVLGLDRGTWRLGGLSVHAGALDDHDGVWYWSRARDLVRAESFWSASFSFDMARYLLVPFSFISSPNLEKLNREQRQIPRAPTFPYTLVDGARTWKLTGIRPDSSLRHADLGVSYESVGASDPASFRTEAVTVLSAVLKAQPGLRENFHGMWAYAFKDGKQSFALELAMKDIPSVPLPLP